MAPDIVLPRLAHPMVSFPQMPSASALSAAYTSLKHPLAVIPLQGLAPT